MGKMPFIGLFWFW